MQNALAERSQKEMTDVLMDPKAIGPDVHYFMLRGGSERKNITVWLGGMVGEEYIKAYGHYHVDDLPEKYEILFGEGILMLQTRKIDTNGMPIDDEVEDVKAIFVKQGSVVEIPGKAGHLMVNTGESWLVTGDDSPVNLGQVAEALWPAHADYAPVKKMRGFAYYVVKKDNKPSFIKNPNYKNIPDIVILNG